MGKCHGSKDLVPVRYGKPGGCGDEVPEEFVWGMFVRHQGGQRGWSGATRRNAWESGGQRL